MKPNTSQTVAGVFTYTNFYLINLTDQPNYNHVQKIWKNLKNKTVTRNEKLMECTMSSCTTIASNNC